ncbi:MAG: YjgP/YjgQ family permease [Gemmataceae bacterium]|nr:YjgP/YjgQ family permease [Gemmataceae bacterium]
MFGILQRMVFWELFKVFFISLVGITGILLMAGIIAEATQQGLGPTQILAAIPLLIPSTLPYTIPATTLFATCVVYGRMSHDNEVLAIRAAGINLGNILVPGLVLGLLMSAATMGLYYRIIPYTHHLLRAMVFNDAEELLYSMLKKDGRITHANIPYAMFVKGVNGKKLISPTFKRRDAKGQIDVVAQAREAMLTVDRKRMILKVHMRFGIATFEDGSKGYFEDRVWEVPLPTNYTSEANRRARDLTWQEILEKRADFQQELLQVQHEIQQGNQKIAQGDARPDLPLHVANLKDRILHIKEQKLFLNVELLMRPALSMGCFCFILIGCPVGIWISKSDYLSSFITCFLPIIVLYYPLQLCGIGLAKEGKIDPILMVWVANLLILGMGGILSWKIVRT